MKILNFFKKNEDEFKTDFFQKNNLKEWWLSEFTVEEREYIKSESSVLLDSRYNHNKSPAETLYLLAGYVNTKNTEGHQYLAQLILDKACQLTDDPIIKFKICSQLINLHFEHRNDAEEIKLKIIKLCKEQIELSELLLNSSNRDESMERVFKLEHQGYQKLAVLNIENGEFEKAEELINKAKEEGWNGSWDKLEVKLK